jgi:hypothetical protein
MTNYFLMSAAAAALIAATGLANAQGTGMGRDTGPATQQSAPGPERAAPSAATPMNRNDATDSKGSESGIKSTQSEEKVTPGGKNRAQDTAPDQKSKTLSSDKSSVTTGQAGAGAKQLTTEQRTRISTVIKQQNVQPATNINFSISVGTKVPRTVAFHALPTEIISVYPDWRGYEFFLVSNQIIVVNPRTLEIVAVLDA